MGQRIYVPCQEQIARLEELRCHILLRLARLWAELLLAAGAVIAGDDHGAAKLHVWEQDASPFQTLGLNGPIEAGGVQDSGDGSALN